MISRLILKNIDKVMKKRVLSNPNYPKKILEEKYALYHAFVRSFDDFVEKKRATPYFDSLIKSFLPNLLPIASSQDEKREKFKSKFGTNPPAFLAISPGKFCNLHCEGCYACSDSAAKEKLSFDVFDWIMKEKDSWGSWFTVISGGEPLLWKSDGKNIFDIAKKYPGHLFLMYTNGTAITKEVALKLASVGNITPAISVEGFELETDARRGNGVFKQILKAMDNLNDAGVPFGISITATKKNVDLILSGEVFKFFKEKGALYNWMFQLMPIGRGSFDLLISGEERAKLYHKVQDLIKEGYFIADFWNCGAISDGCISAGRDGGYFYIEWNGNITPCAFNPYAVGNAYDLFTQARPLGEVLNYPYMKHIREWQSDYGFQKHKDSINNWILPCPIRDHYQDLRKIIDKDQPKPIDESATEALIDPIYKESMISYDESLAKALNPIWDQKQK